MRPEPIFSTGGALAPDYPHYVLRQADQDATLAIEKGKLIYVIAPRQMGKTSLLRRLAVSLENQGWYCCFADLATLRNLERPRWFQHLGNMIASASEIDASPSRLEDQQDFRSFLLRDIGLGLSLNPIKIALFFDEVEGLLGLDFSDEFLMTLRDLYQQRDSYVGQLLIAFAGSADPETLVKDPIISPFNVAEEIVVDDFTTAESMTLTSNLTDLGIPVVEAVHSHIYEWAAGQPHLTQRICEIIESWAKTQKITSVSIDVVDRSVHTGLLAPRNRDKNVKHVLGEIAELRSNPAELWQRLLRDEPVYSTEAGFYALFLTGAVAEAPDGRVKIRNPIYERAVGETQVPPDPDPRVAPQPRDEFSYDVFISYSHVDRKWVWDELLPRLEKARLRTCIDQRDFEIGVPSLVNIERAVDDSRHTLIVLTPDWLKSEWTEFESLLVGTADPAGRRRKLIPLMLKPCSLPPRIAMLTYADFTRRSDREAEMTRLVKSLRSLVESGTPLKLPGKPPSNQLDRPVPYFLAFASAVVGFAVGVLGNLVAAWIQEDILHGTFTPTGIAATVVLTVIGLVMGVWLQRRTMPVQIKRTLYRVLAVLALVAIALTVALLWQSR